MELDEWGYPDFDDEENGTDNGPMDHTDGPLYQYLWNNDEDDEVIE